MFLRHFDPTVRYYEIVASDTGCSSSGFAKPVNSPTSPRSKLRASSNGHSHSFQGVNPESGGWTWSNCKNLPASTTSP